MISDAYTKFVLTVIAGALVIIAVQNFPFVLQAQAQDSEESSRTAVCDSRNTDSCARVENQLIYVKLCNEFSGYCADFDEKGALLVSPLETASED